LEALGADYPEFELVCVCQELVARRVGKVLILPWMKALEHLGF
jgi:hypothetical protein